ncbi:hypothetical protein GALL_58440 [mine drainage metagenome]|uniref:Uncharacterized protein n=1 Tax=mine drainage metagenome TaxID=410659 RepID=A0A1J5SW71_9ZZZZ
MDQMENIFILDKNFLGNKQKKSRSYCGIFFEFFISLKTALLLLLRPVPETVRGMLTLTTSMQIQLQKIKWLCW